MCADDDLATADDLSLRFGPGPFGALLGFRVVRADRNGAIVEADPGADHVNGGGIVHGGYLSALLDTTTGWAVEPHLPVGVGAPHIQLGVQYVKAALPGATLTCRGRCITAGRRIISAEAEVTQGDRVIARAITSHLVLARASA